MAKKASGETSERGVHAASMSDLQDAPKRPEGRAPKPAKPSSLLDTRVVYCGETKETVWKFLDEQVTMKLV